MSSLVLGKNSLTTNPSGTSRYDAIENMMTNVTASLRFVLLPRTLVMMSR